MKITIMTKNSAIALFLIANVFTSIYALPLTTKVRIENKKESLSLQQDVEDVLIRKGLQEDIAKKRVTQLFTQEESMDKLSYLYSSRVLEVSKEKLDMQLAELALFNKEMELNSYKSLYTLVQSTKRDALTKRQKDELKALAAI